MSTKIPKWILDRNTAIEQEQAEWRKHNAEYFAFPEGETIVQINTDVVPTKKLSKYGNEQWVYNAFINKEKKKISVNVMLDRAIIQALVEEINPMTIIRVGKDKNTRYSIKELS